MKSALSHSNPFLALLAVVEVTMTLAEGQAAAAQQPQIADVLMQYESVRVQNRKETLFTWTPEAEDRRADEFEWLRTLAR